MLISGYFLCIGLAAFIVFGIDKWKAQRNAWRIPETTLLLMAFVGGAWGAWLGMKIFHHKTKHAKFRYGIPLLFLWNVAIILFILYPHAYH